MINVLVLHGPNLNMLGKREVSIYGSLTLNDINQSLHIEASKLGVSLTTFQSNAEHELIDTIHDALGNVDFIIINPAAYTHTSVALRDALLAVSIPFVEVHLSNVHQRESFRQHSYFSDKADAVICGCGAQGYQFALKYAVEKLENSQALEKLAVKR